MEKDYREFDTYNEDIIANAQYIIEKAENDPEFMAEYFDTYRAAMEINTAVEKRARIDRIEKRRLNQKHEQKLRFGYLKGLIIGTALGISAFFAGEQLQGGNILANQVATVLDDNGYGYRDDSQAGIIFNQNGSFVDFDTAMNNIVSKCEERGMTPAQIDAGLKTVLGIQPKHSTLGERIMAKNDAYHASKVESIGMGK